MKILFISDIHGIVTNLDLIAKKIKEVDKLIVLGDLYYPGFNNLTDLEFDNNKVKDFLLSYKDKLICMRGNCDSDVDVKVSDFVINEGVSLLNVDNIDMYITHGNLYSYSKEFDLKGILIYGHEHIPYIKRKDNNYYICVGSISLPRGESKPSYMIYDNKVFTLYDIFNDLIDTLEME